MAAVDERTKVSAPFVMQIGGWIVGLMLVYGAVNARVAVLEAKYDNLREQLVQINQKLDRLMEARRP
jgi:outer membrane murein-binding lipoprotein Lpp